MSIKYHDVDVGVTLGGGGSGGGGIVILSGTSAPSSSQGEDGDVYLQYYTVPSGYTPKEYLEVTSSGPYIDTGVQNTSDAYYWLDAQYTSAPSNNYGIFGSAAPNKEFTINNYGGVSFFNAGGTRGIFTSANLVRHVFECTSAAVLLDGANTGATVNWNNATSLTYYLFAFHYSSSPGIYKTANARIYGCKLYNGSTLVRNFIPCVRDSDSEPGMYDLVNDVFYDNDGSGSFSVGSTVTASPIISAYAKVSGAWQALIGTDINDINLGS